jgi:DNA-binding YbaB/EbfC family protein
MMKQYQKMQEDLQKMQEQLEASSFTAAAGGGAVKATVSGKRELTMLQIDPGAVDPEDVEMLQDMIIAAVNEALRQVEDASSDNMAKLTGMNGLPF